MSKSSRRHSDRIHRPARATHQRPASYAAGSDISWNDLLYRDPWNQPTGAPSHRENRRQPSRPATAFTLTRTRRRPVAAFSSWFPTLPPVSTVKRLLGAFSCARRAQRRETLFATRRTGAGSRSPKRHYSNRRCI